MVQSPKTRAGEHMMHRAYENLYKEFSQEQASVIADILETQKEILEIQKEEIIYKARNSLNSEFATKSDLRAEIAEAKAELKQNIAEVKAELKEDIATLDSKLVNAELKLTKEITEAKAELKQNVSNVEKQLTGTNAELITIKSKIKTLEWMAGTIIALLAIILTGIGIGVSLLAIHFK